MKVTLKTVQGTQFGLELEEGTKIADVKAMVQSKQGEGFLAEKMLLIYKGQVLKDDTTLGENNVTENGFMVIMMTKDKKAPEPAPAAPAPAAAPAAEAAPATPAAPAAAPAAAAAVPAGTPDYSSAASALATGSALESSVSMICEMGFEREQVMRAMRAAFNNPDRAVEFLMNGIPETEEVPPPEAAAAGGAAPGGAAADAAGGGPNAQPLDMFPQGMPGMEGGASGTLDFLRSNTQFQALRQMVQANPQILQPMLQELGKQNPQLLQLINSNQQEFLRLINEPAPEGVPGMDELAAMAGGGEGAVTIELSQEDRDAIERLEALGFDRNMCVEAYFACEKNESLAANFLLENGDQ
mmetsp:Transcript_14944/g.38398  ORF Transcript_14944/g.38398 Transcript_14944/m.38398 type:complete len:355 (-) Transcript_14944:31-1095(-)